MLSLNINCIEVQVIKKRRIVIASVLKPADDTRAFEKLGLALASAGHEVHSIGQAPTTPPGGTPVVFHALPALRRISVKRFFIGLRVLRILIAIRPTDVIVNTPELLPAGIAYCALTGTRLYYDVLENYYRNIRYTPVYPRGIRLLLALAVRFTEHVARPFVHHFFLAEDSYQHEMPFLIPATVLPNKPPVDLASRYPRLSTGPYQLLFTGTLAESTGVWEAIRLTRSLHTINPSFQLQIIGYSPVAATVEKIRHEIASSPFIQLTGGHEPVAHATILSAIAHASWGIIYYPANPSTAGSMPTKLYEYLALGLPVLIHHTAPAHQLVRDIQAGLILSDFSSPETLEQALHQHVTFHPAASVFFESHATDLIQVIETH